jgi:hypothetical protein
MNLVRLIKMCLNETYSKACIGKHLSDSFPIQNGLKQVDALLPLLFNSALEYAIRKVQENRVWQTKWDMSASGLRWWCESTLIDASKEIGLEINAEKTKYMFLSRHQNVGQNRDIKITNRWFGNVSQFIYLGITVTNQNFIQEEIRRRLISGNACYHSVQNIVFSSVVKKLKN